MMTALDRSNWRMSTSTPEFLPYPRPPEGAPNVVMIVLDDVGFAQLGCFGSPISTPSIDRLATGGLRYNRFHVTSICSSTRAALLTGRNHHAVGVGMTMETPLGFPGYTGRIPATAALLPRVLRDNGYSTLAVGKWHLCPRGEYSASGPMTRWPLGMGFERYYGFLGAETNQWAPELCRDNTFVDPPRSPAEGYHLTEDLVDQAIRMVLDQRQATPAKPFFCYIATGAAHAPHQVPGGWIDQYAGCFDEGWEELRTRTYRRQLEQGVIPPGTDLTDRPPWVPDWEALSDGERRLFSRYMEVFAAFLTHTDAQLGRFLDFLEHRGELDNTIVVLVSDNGASAEGTPTGTLNESRAWLAEPEPVEAAIPHIDEIGGHRTFNHYPWGWAWAGNTPFHLWKRYAWLGGVRTPLILRWPGHLAQTGAVRAQFCHAIDIYPTILDALGIPAPAVVDGVDQQPIDGASLVPTFADAAGPDPRHTQYFEMHGSRGIYHRGWKATTNYVSPMFNERSRIAGSEDFDDDRWCLFDLDRDFAEAHDLSEEEPEQVQLLQELWWAEAERNQVLPLFEGPDSLAALHPPEYAPPPAASYHPGGGPVYEAMLPAMIGGFAVTAEIQAGERGRVEGIICAMGDRNDGWALYLVDGRPVATVVSFGWTTRIAAPSPVGDGAHEVSLRYRPGGNGRDNLFLLVDGSTLAAAHHPQPFAFPAVATAGGGMLVGVDRGLAVADDYQPPFPFNGILVRVRIESGAPSDSLSSEEILESATRSD
jgi:arylsulfatase A-like enzyme